MTGRRVRVISPSRSRKAQSRHAQRQKRHNCLVGRVTNRLWHDSYPTLKKQCPIERQIMKQGVIVEIAELGGLDHRYERIAA